MAEKGESSAHKSAPETEALVIVPLRQSVYRVAFGDTKLASTGKGEHFSSPSRLFGKAIRDKIP